MDLEYIRRVGIAAAYDGGAVLRSCLGNLSSIGKKGAIDLVTEADIGSEEKIIAAIRSRFPEHAILAEESGAKEGMAECQWIIDPLDGTTNFAHQIPLFAVSIAFAYRGEVVAGVVLNPVSGELFTAVQGQGAERNGEPVRVSGSSAVSESLLVTGFPYNFKEILDTVIGRFRSCLKASRGVRRLGAAALDLCFVACGRFDGFWEENLKPWDTAAGMLIVAEAGGSVTDFKGKPFVPEDREILATNGKIHSELMSLLALKEEQ
jgi:myo-inositol-1(or 4)-monophosphatase